MRKLLIALVILPVLLVVIDRASLFVAEREIGTRVQAAYLLPRPAVSIHGFPFLTQVMNGQYQQVDITIASAAAGSVQLRDISASFTGVHASLSLLLGQNSGGVTAEHATGTALIPFSQVQLRVPKGIRLTPAGRSSLRVAGTTAFGTIKGIARLGVTKSGITVTPQQLSVGGISAGALVARFTFVIGVGSLPLHLTMNGVHVAGDGLVVTATGQDVQFASA